MTDLQTPDHTPSPAQPAEAPKGRRRISSIGLVAGGLLAGGVLASTMSAGATTTDPAPEATTTPEANAQDRERGPRAHSHHQRTPLDAETAAQVEAAITQAYPGATVIRMGALPNGTYAAHIVDADDAHLAVKLDESFAVADSTTLPAPLDAATAASVEAAVLAEYPGATVIRMGALPEGGYGAHLVTAEDTHVAVKLDDGFAVTGELTRDEIREGMSDRLGRLGDRLERGSDHLDRLNDRIDRLRDRLNAETPANA